MSNKTLALGTVVVLVSIVAVTLVVGAGLMLQAINPLAALAAVAVALVGLAWFKKTAKN